MPRQADQHFDDILRHVGEFGLWQKFLYFSSCFLVIVSSAIQIASLVFATGTPKFHCVTPNVTCDENKCCAECTSYTFDQSFTSTVTEVRIDFISCFVTVISGLDLETRPTSSILIRHFYGDDSQKWYQQGPARPPCCGGIHLGLQDPTTRQRRERNRFDKQNNNCTRAASFLKIFFAVFERLRLENA